jgi:hypothetical protein
MGTALEDRIVKQAMAIIRVAAGDGGKTISVADAVSLIEGQITVLREVLGLQRSENA